MKIKYILIIIALFAVSCQDDEAYVQVQNKVHNSTLTGISFGEYNLYSQIRPGEKTEEYLITDEKQNWPKTSVISFTMEANNSTIFLTTEEEFTLYPSDSLLIVIHDTTVVVNPLQ